ncbi:hypothetical protein EJ110_NYTH20764 [Nymphaea thermarum]|nr:hypothetical protein EJ110_NYTH20764 [Nymphaea thermarum]
MTTERGISTQSRIAVSRTKSSAIAPAPAARYTDRSIDPLSTTGDPTSSCPLPFVPKESVTSPTIAWFCWIFGGERLTPPPVPSLASSSSPLSLRFTSPSFLASPPPPSLPRPSTIEPNGSKKNSGNMFPPLQNDDSNTFLYNDDFRLPPNNHLQFSRVDNYMPFAMQLDCSIIDGDHMELEIVIKQDEDQDWGLWVDDTMIGFWPKSNCRARYANKISWGGEIVNKRTRGRHTSTHMGNGHFSNEPIGKVAYIRNMAIYNLVLDRYEAPEAITLIINKPDCYDVRYFEVDDDDDDGYRQHITFGGRGYDRIKCP